jgi:hypothetical protein
MDAFAALATPQDQGECSPAVHAGERLVVRAAYRSLDGPRFVVWGALEGGRPVVLAPGPATRGRSRLPPGLVGAAPRAARRHGAERRPVGRG